MFHSVDLPFRSAVVERLTLLVNHVIAAEHAAVQRLKPHAGRCIRLQFVDMPRLFGRPAPLPPADFCVTPAGLLEWCGDAPVAEPALCVTVDASNPALGLLGAVAGQRPKIEVAGDAAFAADLHWLLDNLRWDLEDDLARVVGQAPAHQIARIARATGAALRATVQGVDALVRQRRGGLDDAPSR